MRLTLAMSRWAERRVQGDNRDLRIDASWREWLLEASLMVAATASIFASIALALVAGLATSGSDGDGAKLLRSATATLILAGVGVLVAHLVRYIGWYAFWYVRRRGREPNLGALPRRVPVLMSTDWDFALLVAIVAAAALSG